MRELSELEMREHNEWIAVNVFGWQQFREDEYPHRMLWREGDAGSPVWDEPGNYCEDPAASRELEKKCSGVFGLLIFNNGESGFRVGAVGKGYLYADAQTLELAIALFARKLFTKESK